MSGQVSLLPSETAHLKVLENCGELAFRARQHPLPRAHLACPGVVHVDRAPETLPLAAQHRSARLDFLQADNQMRTFAKETGGMAFFPRFYGEFPSIFQNISASLRNQYTMTYNPTNQTRDGKFRKLKVEVPSKDLHVKHRAGYFAPS